MIHDLDQFQTDCSNGQAITTMAGSSNIKMQDSLPFEIDQRKHRRNQKLKPDYDALLLSLAGKPALQICSAIAQHLDLSELSHLTDLDTLRSRNKTERRAFYKRVWRNCTLDDADPLALTAAEAVTCMAWEPNISVSSGVSVRANHGSDRGGAHRQIRSGNRPRGCD